MQFSEWAALIVSILRPDDSIRICVDYKSTVNQVSKLDSYPMPKVEDLLATLGGGECSQKWMRAKRTNSYGYMMNLKSTPPSTRTRECSSTTVYPIITIIITLWDIISTRNISAEHGESTA